MHISCIKTKALIISRMKMKQNLKCLKFRLLTVRNEALKNSMGRLRRSERTGPRSVKSDKIKH